MPWLLKNVVERYILCNIDLASNMAWLSCTMSFMLNSRDNLINCPDFTAEKSLAKSRVLFLTFYKHL